MKRKAFIKYIITFLVFFSSLWILQRLLMPKYMHGIVEGAMTAEYYEDAPKHDVVFIGDCELYENISTITLWKEYGISSYIRGNAQQLIWQSYYLMEDTLRYEKPKAFVINVLSLKYDEPEKEAYNRMTLDGMRWSSSKVKAINASMLEEESFLDYVFPLLRYHSRWKELNRDDLTYLFSRDKVTHSGYYMRTDVKAVGELPSVRPLGNYEFGQNAWTYLDMMAALCEENNIQLILVKAPSLMPHWYDEWEEQVRNYAEKRGLPYYNFLECKEEIGLDYSSDTYDAGLHLNLSGAEKLASYIGRILSEDYDIPDMRKNRELSAIWEEKCLDYEKERRLQEERINSGEAVRE